MRRLGFVLSSLVLGCFSEVEPVGDTGAGASTGGTSPGTATTTDATEPDDADSTDDDVSATSDDGETDDGQPDDGPMDGPADCDAPIPLLLVDPGFEDWAQEMEPSSWNHEGSTLTRIDSPWGLAASMVSDGSMDWGVSQEFAFLPPVGPGTYIMEVELLYVDGDPTGPEFTLLATTPLGENTFVSADLVGWSTDGRWVHAVAAVFLNEPGGELEVYISGGGETTDLVQTIVIDNLTVRHCAP